jgi:four helix bundle protein
MARPKSNRDLLAWQKAMALARSVYLVSDGLPKREACGLADQMRRDAVSLASNIAEGYGRLSDLQFRNFLGSARGSLYEVQTQLEPATDLCCFKKEDGRQLMDQSSEAARIRSGLIASLGSNKSSNIGGSNSASPSNPANSPEAHVS